MTTVGAYTAELAGLVARAEALFAARRPRSLAVCTDCCMAPEREAEILATPQNEITADQIEDWLSAAFDPVQGAPAVAWLTPAILRHLAAADDADRLDFSEELALARHAPLSAWTEDQAALLGDFARALLDARLDQPHPRFDTLACMVSRAGLPMKLLTDHLAEVTPLRLARAILADLADPDSSRPSGHWTEPEDARAFRAALAPRPLAERLAHLAETADVREADAMLEAADALFDYASGAK